jgi:methyl-accepting chemotaxis protein
MRRLNSTIKTQVLTLVVVPILIVAAAFISVGMLMTNKLIDESNGESAEYIEHTIQTILDEWRTSTLKLAKAVALNPTDDVAEAILASDTDGLISLVKEEFESTECDGMTFTDVEGNAIARVTNPSKFGDNIKTSQAIADAMGGEYVSYAYPTQNNGFSMTAGVPIVYDGSQIGVLFVSKRLDNDARVEQLKSVSGSDISIYQYDVLVKSTLPDAGEEVTLSEELWQSIQEGNSEEVREGNTIKSYTPINGKNSVVGAIESTKELGSTTWMALIWIGMLCLILVILIPVAIANVNGLVKPIKKLSVDANTLSNGDVSVEITQNRKDELGVLQESMLTLGDTMRKQSEVLEKVAGGDLSLEYTTKSDRDSVGNSLVRLLSLNRKAMGEVLEASSRVLRSVEQLSEESSGIASISAKNKEQISEISGNMSKILSQADKNGETADKAIDISGKSKIVVEETNENINELTDAMSKISEQSQLVAKVIKTIDDIAFQTNILALNASVEAARAGVHGKGFAVVADEVGALAQKSAEAAKQTTDIIGRNVVTINESDALYKKAMGSFSLLVENIGSIGSMLDEIAVGSKTQLELIKNAENDMKLVTGGAEETVNRINGTVELNKEIRAEAELLERVVKRFKI